MSETTTTTTTSLSDGQGLTRNFERLSYWLRTSKGDFEIVRFRESFSEDSHSDNYVLVAPRNGERGRYSVICSWIELDEDIELNIEFVNEAWKHAPDEREPYSEDFVRWLGQFFKNPSVKSHLHARLQFPLDTRETTFPLKLEASLPSGAMLNGVSVRLAQNSLGVITIQIIRGQSEWYAEIVSERDMTFSEFDPYADVGASMVVLADFLAERPS